MLSDRYVAEFMEKYERLNLKGYNSGGYAYRESKKIFARAEEEAKAQRSNLKDISSLAESVRIKSSAAANNVAQPSLFDKMKKAIGLQVAEEIEQQDLSLADDEIEMLDEQGHIQYRKLNTAMLKKYKNPFRILYLWSMQETLEV